MWFFRSKVSKAMISSRLIIWTSSGRSASTAWLSRRASLKAKGSQFGTVKLTTPFLSNHVHSWPALDCFVFMFIQQIELLYFCEFFRTCLQQSSWSTGINAQAHCAQTVQVPTKLSSSLQAFGQHGNLSPKPMTNIKSNQWWLCSSLLWYLYKWIEPYQGARGWMPLAHFR